MTIRSSGRVIAMVVLMTSLSAHNLMREEGVGEEGVLREGVL